MNRRSLFKGLIAVAIGSKLIGKTNDVSEVANEEVTSNEDRLANLKKDYGLSHTMGKSLGEIYDKELLRAISRSYKLE